MYLRSQDILHVIFVLHGGGPVHLDLLLGLLLGLGFTKLYPKRHDALLCVSVCWSLVISLSPLSPHFTESDQAALAAVWLAPPRVVCAKLSSADGPHCPQCPAQSTGPAPDLERQNLSLELSTGHWVTFSLSRATSTHRGRSPVSRYLYLKIWPLIVFCSWCQRVFMDHLVSNPV